MRDGNAPWSEATKPTNPKDAAAFGKRIAFTVIPFRVLGRVALALAEGAWKYGRHNYRAAGVNTCVYVDATLRHLFAFVEGQDIDPDSGFHHIDKAIASLVVLRDGILEGNVTDDRPPAIEGDFVKSTNSEYEDLGKRMSEAHGPPRAPFTEIDKPIPYTLVEPAEIARERHDVEIAACEVAVMPASSFAVGPEDFGGSDYP